ncbi:MAG: hypothetical protein HGA85_02765 [Nanoarchaeota archaeon]|nr:hypothetical protein [Nanoarchaeota archaeon]
MAMKVKYYSSGMKARLAFSVAMHSSHTILLIDETISVGDEEFKRKCLKAIQQKRTEGKQLVLVSHDLNMVMQFCDKVAYLKDGKIKCLGAPGNVLPIYLLDSLRLLSRTKAVASDRTQEINSLINDLNAAERLAGLTDIKNYRELLVDMIDRIILLYEQEVRVADTPEQKQAGLFMLDRYLFHRSEYSRSDLDETAGRRAKVIIAQIALGINESLLSSKLKEIYNLHRLYSFELPKISEMDFERYGVGGKFYYNLILCLDKDNLTQFIGFLNQSMKKQDFREFLLHHIEEHFLSQEISPVIRGKVLSCYLSAIEPEQSKKKGISTILRFIIDELVKLTVEKRQIALSVHDSGSGYSLKEISELRSELARHFNSLYSSEKGDAKILDISISSGANASIQTGGSLVINIKFMARKKLTGLTIGIAIRNEEGLLLAGPNSGKSFSEFHSGINSITCTIENQPFLNGSYFIDVVLHKYDHSEVYALSLGEVTFTVDSRNPAYLGSVGLKPGWKLSLTP